MRNPTRGLPSVVPQQPLASGTVSGLDAHRAVRGEATALRPLPHRACGIARQQAATDEHAQQPPAHALLHRGEGLLIQPGGGMEDDPARDGGVEHAVDDDAVEVQVGIQRRPEAVNERDRTEAGRGARTQAVRTKMSTAARPVFVL